MSQIKGDHTGVVGYNRGAEDPFVVVANTPSTAYVFSEECVEKMPVRGYWLSTHPYNEKLTDVRAKYGVEIGDEQPSSAGTAFLLDENTRIGVAIDEDEDEYVLHVPSEDGSLVFERVAKSATTKVTETVADQLASRSDFSMSMTR